MIELMHDFIYPTKMYQNPENYGGIVHTATIINSIRVQGHVSETEKVERSHFQTCRHFQTCQFLKDLMTLKRVYGPYTTL